jgi:hypothetical protein
VAVPLRDTARYGEWANDTGGCHDTVGAHPAAGRLRLLRQLHRPRLRLLRQLQVVATAGGHRQADHGGHVVGSAGVVPLIRKCCVAWVAHADWPSAPWPEPSHLTRIDEPICAAV